MKLQVVTNFKVKGQRQNVRIRIPINSNRPFIIENYRGQNIDNIPGQLHREISNALEDKETRERCMADLIYILKDSSSVLSSEEKVRQIFNQLSKAF